MRKTVALCPFPPMAYVFSLKPAQITPSFSTLPSSPGKVAAHPWGTLCSGVGGWGDVVGAIAFARLVRVTAVNGLTCQEPCLHSCKSQ